MAGNVVAGGRGRVVPEFGRAFVGRDRELAALADALGRPPAVLLVEGEAGIGKSRLVRELLASPEGQRYRCLTVTCPPFREPFTLGPVVDAIRQATGHVTGLRLSGLAGALRPLFPEWAADLPPTPEPVEDIRASRHRVFRALTEILDRLNVGLLVLEDAHWADEASLEFSMFVASQPARPISMVVTYRPEDVPADSLLPRLVSRAPANATLTRVSLSGLDARRTGELVSSMLGGDPVSREFVESLCRRTGGIPFVLEQLVRLMYDRADLIHQDGQWMRHELHIIEVPPTVRDAILERVHRLPRGVGEILRAAAVLGDPADEATLLAVADQPDGDDSVTGAIDSGLLVADGDVLTVRHALAATAIYDTIPASRRRELHSRAGRTLEAVPGQPSDRLAHHFREAGQMSEWYPYAERAANQALATGDRVTAVPLLRDLLAHADRPDMSVLKLLDKVAFSMVDPDAGWSDLIGALRSVLTTSPGSRGLEARVRFQLGRLLILADRYNEGRVEMERAIPHLGHDPLAAARAMFALAVPSDGSRPVSEHLRWLRRAAALPPPDDPADRLALRVIHVSRLLELGQDAGWRIAADLPHDAGTVRERHILASGQINLADAAMRWGRYTDARAYLTRAQNLADRDYDPWVHDMAESTSCHVDWFTGHWNGLADRARELDTDDALTLSRWEARLVTGLVSVAVGPDAHDEERLAATLDYSHSHPDFLIEAAAALARSWLASGRFADAIHVTDAPIHATRGKGWLWATELAPVRAEALLAAGRRADAEDLVDRFARGLRGLNAPAPRAALAVCRALLAEHHADHSDAARRYARVAGAWREMPRPYDALLAEERRAGCLLASGREADGRDLLAAVLRGLTELGAVVARDRVAGRLRELGVDAARVRRGRRGYGTDLSPSELDVVRLVVTGKTNREIGQVLSRSPRTVSTQVYSAMRKLRVSSRTELAVRALDDGIASGDASPSSQ